jgi:tetratricopeptide (TPR) repeat protein
MDHLEELLKVPPDAMAPDDVADALAILADAQQDDGQPQSARATRERQLEIMERAASAATTPSMAATYDYQRANAYLALGQGDQAIALLEARMAELPGSYEPPARLASILERMGEPERALQALERALQHAYGPRRLQYLAQKARLNRSLGRSVEELQALEEEVQGYSELSDGHRNASRRRDAEHRLEEARRRQAN